jgi:hypothetical protein
VDSQLYYTLARAKMSESMPSGSSAMGDHSVDKGRYHALKSEPQRISGVQSAATRTAVDPNGAYEALHA